MKLARRFWRETGHDTKKIVIGREKAYHGMHVAGTALAGIPVNHDGYGELMADVRTVAWDTGKALLEPSKISAPITSRPSSASR